MAENFETEDLTEEKAAEALEEVGEEIPIEDEAPEKAEDAAEEEAPDEALEDEADAEKSEEKEEGKPKGARTFDFIYDSAYIYQSFASLYQIRLITERMHWWEFLTLFNGLMLSDENSMNFVVGVRQKKMNDVPASLRGAYVKMKKEFMLPKSESVKQAENAVYDMLEAMWSENNG